MLRRCAIVVFQTAHQFLLLSLGGIALAPLKEVISRVGYLDDDESIGLEEHAEIGVYCY